MNDDLASAEELGSLISDLGIGPIRTVGRPPKSHHLAYERDLTAADMAALATLPRSTGQVPTLQKIRASHHSLARCLASGMKQSEASLVTGYSQPRISVLMSDPAFKSLVEDYKSEARSEFADLAARMSNLSVDAIDEIQERLNAKPEDFTISTLMDIVTKFADRTGFGPGQEVTHTHKMDYIDRPPRETFEDWERRRQGELAPREGQILKLVKPCPPVPPDPDLLELGLVKEPVPDKGSAGSTSENQDGFDQRHNDGGLGERPADGE